MNSKLIKIAAFIFFIIPMVCQAEIIKIGFTGKVDYIDDLYNLLDGKVHQNQSITGFYIYDSSTSDSEPSIYGGLYQYTTEPYGMSITISDLTFQTDFSLVDFQIGLSNNYNEESYDSYSVTSYNNLKINNNVSIDRLNWQLEDYTGTALSSDLLLKTPPNLLKWQSNDFSILGQDIRSHLFLIQKRHL